MELKRYVLAQLDWILIPDEREKLDKTIKSIESFMLDLMKPEIFDSSVSSSFEHTNDASFEEACISMGESLPSVDPKTLSVYEFLSRARYLKKKFKKLKNVKSN